MLAVGVGSAVTGNPSSRNRLIQIAGPQTVDDDGLDNVQSINEVDVALVRDFDRLANFLRGVVNELCTPSLTVRKLAQTADSADYEPAPNWAITATPTVAGVGSTYQWILPDTDPCPACAVRQPGEPQRPGTADLHHRRDGSGVVPMGTGPARQQHLGGDHRDAADRATRPAGRTHWTPTGAAC